ncbi:KUP/HAK/KT family potassium transporter [Pseudomonas sp. RT6P73]
MVSQGKFELPTSEDSPRGTAERQFEVDAFGEGFFRSCLHFGFMEEPDVPMAKQEVKLLLARNNDDGRILATLFGCYLYIGH